MKARSVLSFLCRLVVAAGSLLVTAHGVYSYLGADLARDMLEMSLYCALPLLSFPVFLLSFKSLRWSVAMHWILAVAYLTVYSALDWQTCSDAGYCQGVTQTVLKTATARPVEAAFAVAVFNSAALLMRRKTRRTTTKPHQA
jgi:hypothetical protein